MQISYIPGTNFPQKYFLGDNENAIEIQIWAALLANLLLTQNHKRERHEIPKLTLPGNAGGLPLKFKNTDIENQ